MTSTATRQNDASAAIAAAIEEFSNSIGQVGDYASSARALTDEIGTALREQTATARDISARIEQVSLGTEELTSSSQTTRASVAQLEQLACKLNALADNFKAV